MKTIAWVRSLYSGAVVCQSKKNSSAGESFILRDESFVREAENVNITDDYGIPIHRSACAGQLRSDAVDLFIEKDADVNHRDKFGRTPLYMDAVDDFGHRETAGSWGRPKRAG